MGMIIDGDGRKRELPKEFQICGKDVELRDFAEQILAKLGERETFCGWIPIRPLPSLMPCVDSKPEPWA